MRHFGRFPHRNPLLGRITTNDEKAFLDLTSRLLDEAVDLAKAEASSETFGSGRGERIECSSDQTRRHAVAREVRFRRDGGARRLPPMY